MRAKKKRKREGKEKEELKARYRKWSRIHSDGLGFRVPEFSKTRGRAGGQVWKKVEDSKSLGV